ncbi:MAG TPA: c-type cytochrome [Flavisolibacter sp.]|nr:c-type cytochrome [Flavisolibacter sp.]
MKKTIIIPFFILLLASCGNNNEQKENNAPGGTTAEKQKDPNVEKGLELYAKSDCSSCHKVDQPFTGPSLTDIAAKYPNNQSTIDSLAGKIIKGGMGNWGTIPMTAHPSLSEEDAKLMVQYILSLKNNL